MTAEFDATAAFGRFCRLLDRRPLLAYGAALACVLAALLLRAALGLITPGLVPFATLYLALALAGLLGGFGPGLAALLVAAVGAWTPLRGSVPDPGNAAANLALLVATGGALVALSGTVRYGVNRLLEGEEQLRLAVRSTGLGIWSVDATTGERHWSPEFRAILGIDLSTPADPQLFSSLIHPDDRERTNAAYRAAYDSTSGGWYEAEFRIHRADDGAERCVATTGRVFFDGQGRPARAAGTILEVTSRHLAATALRESEERYRALVETSPDAVHVHRDGVIILANQQAALLFGGRQPSDIVGRTAMSLVDEASLELARGRTAQLTAPGTLNAPIELTLRRLDGRPVTVEASSAAVMIDGRLAVQAVLRDITERRRNEVALRESETRFRLAAAAVHGIVYDLDLLTGAAWRSDGLERVLGIAPNAVPESETWWVDLIHPDDALRVARDATLLGDPAVTHLDREYRVRHADGHWVHLHDRSFVVRDAAGRAVRLIGVSTDISERKAAEARQVLLMHEVDHRAKNALAVVQSLVRLSRAETRSDFAEAIEGRVAAMARAHTLLARNGWRGADLETLIKDELAAFRRDVPFRVDGPPVWLRAEAVQPLAMVIHELATNAARHGALSRAEGRLEVAWHIDPEGGVRLRWQEKGGPPIAAPPLESGFGTMLMQTTMVSQLGGRFALSWQPDGLVVELSLGARQLSDRQSC